MNFNMMYKNRMHNQICRTGIIIICFLLTFQLFSLRTYAKEEEKLPKGEILLIYSDHVTDEEMSTVHFMVENFTYQGFRITYAPVSECVNQISEYQYIICYNIDTYPKEILEEMKKREEVGNSIYNARKGTKNSSGENDIRLMIIGNKFFCDYMVYTGRKSMITDGGNMSASVTYEFSSKQKSQVLTKADQYYFYNKEMDSTAGKVVLQDTEGYFCAKIGALYHIPVIDFSSNVVKAAFAKETALFKWPYSGEPHVYAQYMVLDKVYPFQDQDKLLEVVKYFISKNEPFIISVMPVYANGDFPAMQHFCEILRYAQSNGGTILINSPINQMNTFDKELVNDYMSTAINIYVEHGVYPMGIEVPSNWLFNRDTIDVMSRFSTVLVSDETDQRIEADDTAYTNLVYEDGHQWIGPAISIDKNGTSYLKINSTAVKFDLDTDMEFIKQKVEACITSEVPLKSLWDVEHSFWTEEHVMTYKKHIILLDGKRIENQFKPTEYDENYQYNRNMLQRFSKDLTSENQKLVIMVVIISIIFISFILIARYRNRKRFIIHTHKKK